MCNMANPATPNKSPVRKRSGRTTSTATKSSAKPRKATPTEPDALWIADVVRNNIRILKGLRRLSDEQITQRGRYTSRQVYHNRLNGPVDFSTEDFARIASALDVEPHVLLMSPAEVMQWAMDHPEYKGPTYAPQTPRGGK